MRMQKTDLEFVVFDSRDVIVTSGGGGEPIPTVIPIIWLSPESVTNYNAITTGLPLDTRWVRYNKYSSFSGAVFPPSDMGTPEYYSSGEYYQGTGAPTVGLYTVGKDGSGFNDVLNWLRSKALDQ